jgi:hypothetical protein
MKKFFASGLLFWGVSEMIRTKGREGFLRSTIGLACVLGIIKEK